MLKQSLEDPPTAVTDIAAKTRLSNPLTTKSFMEVSNKPELKTSPTAQAFFAALDAGGQSNASSLIQKRINTLGWRNRHSQDEFYPVSIQQDGKDIKYDFSVLQVQRGELEGTYGTGATVWPASMVLLKYMQRHATTLLQDKMVVDLGSGTAVTSIAAALLGANRVICTDGEDSVVRLAQDNVTRAKGQCGDILDRIRVEKYWWASGPPPGGNDCVVDVVLVSDCVLPKLYPIAPLVEALDQLLTKPHAVAILSYEHRHYPEYDPRDKFRELATAKGLSVHVVSADEHDPVYSTDDIEIWHVKRKQK